MNSRLGLLLCGSMISTILAIGCGKSVPSLAEVNNTNLLKIRGAYGLYMVRHNMSGPDSEEEFKEFLKTDAGAKVKLERMGVSHDDVDAIFVSARDGEPFKVRYGLTGLGDYPIVFESVGVEGKRFVAFVAPRELDEAEYEECWSRKIKANSGMDVMDQPN